MTDMKVATDILKWLAQIEGTVTIHDGTATDESGVAVDLNQWLGDPAQPLKFKAVDRPDANQHGYNRRNHEFWTGLANTIDQLPPGKCLEIVFSEIPEEFGPFVGTPGSNWSRLADRLKTNAYKNGIYRRLEHSWRGHRESVLVWFHDTKPQYK